MKKASAVRSEFFRTKDSCRFLISKHVQRAIKDAINEEVDICLERIFLSERQLPLSDF